MTQTLEGAGRDLLGSWIARPDRKSQLDVAAQQYWRWGWGSGSLSTGGCRPTGSRTSPPLQGGSGRWLRI
jgi:hypothetical protein